MQPQPQQQPQRKGVGRWQSLTVLLLCVVLAYYGWAVAPRDRVRKAQLLLATSPNLKARIEPAVVAAPAPAQVVGVEVDVREHALCTLITPLGSNEALSVTAANIDCADLAHVNCTIVNGECHLIMLNTSLRIRNRHINFPVVFPFLQQINVNAVGIEIQGNTFSHPGGNVLFSTLKSVSATDPTIVIQHNMGLEKIDFPELHTVESGGVLSVARSS